MKKNSTVNKHNLKLDEFSDFFNTKEKYSGPTQDLFSDNTPEGRRTEKKARSEIGDFFTDDFFDSKTDTVIDLTDSHDEDDNDDEFDYLYNDEDESFEEEILNVDNIEYTKKNIKIDGFDGYLIKAGTSYKEIDTVIDSTKIFDKKDKEFFKSIAREKKYEGKLKIDDVFLAKIALFAKKMNALEELR